MNTTLYFSDAVLDETLHFLHASGNKGHEGIALWLGSRKADMIHVQIVYQPEHRAESDMFHIPPESMHKLKEYLRVNRLFVASQVHSHPFEAFHSHADDKWAIVRHAGALSIVLPNFARHTTTATFWGDAAVFQLSPTNHWEPIPSHKVSKLCKLTP